MRHGKKFNHLGRTAPHREALLSNMASSLILAKRITTTLAKAKALRKYVEPLITKAKTDSCLMELVDFNDLYKTNKEAKKGKTRRGRKSGKKADGAEDATIVAEGSEGKAEGKKEEKPKKEKAPAKKEKKK